MGALKTSREVQPIALPSGCPKLRCLIYGAIIDPTARQPRLKLATCYFLTHYFSTVCAPLASRNCSPTPCGKVLIMANTSLL